MKNIHYQAKELVKQITGVEIYDPQHPDIQIAMYYLEKAWQDGAVTAQNDAAKEIQKNYHPNSLR